MRSETDLYAPVKSFLESQGYTVKAEVTDCDVVAYKDDAPPVVVELKLVFSLELVLQGTERQKLTDSVYLAVEYPDTRTKRQNFRKRRRSIIGLCRRLGLGLLTVDLERDGASQVDVMLDPAPYRPKKNPRKQARLKKEFFSRAGDPNKAGVSKVKIVTSYRQNALRCVTSLADGSVRKLGEIRETSGVSTAGPILQKNHYGWFERRDRGAYCLTEAGKAALKSYADVIAELKQS